MSTHVLTGPDRAGQAVSSPARIYSYLLGGRDYYTADQVAAANALSAVPHAPGIARANRRFVARAVRYMAGQGIAQFVDLGSGLPARPAVHDIARSVVPSARVLRGQRSCCHGPLPESVGSVRGHRGDPRRHPRAARDPRQPATRTVHRLRPATGITARRGAAFHPARGRSRDRRPGFRQVPGAGQLPGGLARHQRRDAAQAWSPPSRMRTRRSAPGRLRPPTTSADSSTD